MWILKILNKWMDIDSISEIPLVINILIMFGIVLISGKFYYTVKIKTLNCLCLIHCMENFGFGCNGIELAINIGGSNCYSGSGYRKLCL